MMGATHRGNRLRCVCYCTKPPIGSQIIYQVRSIYANWVPVTPSVELLIVSEFCVYQVTSESKILRASFLYIRVVYIYVDSHFLFSHHDHDHIYTGHKIYVRTRILVDIA